MPHTRSAKKNLRKTEKRRLHNRAVIRALNKQLKAVLAAVEGSVDNLQKEYNLAAMQLDKAAAKRVIHPNQASRKKSQLSKLLHKKKTGPAAKPA